MIRTDQGIIWGVIVPKPTPLTDFTMRSNDLWVKSVYTKPN